MPKPYNGADMHWARNAVRRMLTAVFQRIARGDPLLGLMPGEDDLP